MVINEKIEVKLNSKSMKFINILKGKEIEFKFNIYIKNNTFYETHKII